MLPVIKFDKDFLLDDEDLTVEDMARLGKVDEREVWHAVEKAVEAHDLWPVINEMRRSAINDLLGTTY